MSLLSILKKNENVDSKLLDAYLFNIANNDKLSLENLYTDTQHAVFGFAFSILKNMDDAQDVLHDTYIKIYSSAPSYKSQGKPMAWILTITRNFCLMKIRQKNKVIDVCFEDLEKSYTINENIKVEDKIVLNTCLKQLSEIEYQIITLHAISGLKHREIAKLLSIPLSTVLSKYNRALKKLKVLLIKENFYE